MKKHFSFSLFSHGIAVGIITMFLLMMMPTIDGMKISVNYGDKSEIFEVEAFEKVFELKAKIKATGLSNCKNPDNYTLRRYNQLNLALENAKTIEECGIVDGETVYLALYEYEIFVWYIKEKDEEEKKFSVWVHQTDTVETLKRKIRNIPEIGIAPENQRLRMHPQNCALDDNKSTLQYYGIVKASMIFVTCVEIMEEEQFNTSAWSLITKMKAKINMPMMVSSYAVESINIFVKYENYLYDFRVLLTDTVKNLKEKIHKTVGILPEHQLLKHGILHRSVPDENETMSSYGIKSLSELSLSLKEKFEIDLKYNGKKYAIAVEATEKVSSLKTKIKKTIKHFENIQLKNLTLSCNGNKLEASQRVKNIYEECIGRGAISVSGEGQPPSEKHRRSPTTQ